MNQKPHLLFPWLNELIRSPKILDAVSSVLGPNLFCWSAQFFMKQPGDGTWCPGIRMRPIGACRSRT